MLNAQPLPLDPIAAIGQHRQQQVGDLVIQQVDFVHIQHAAMGFGQQSGLEDGFARFHRLFHIHRTHQPIFGDAEGNLHEGGGDDAGVGERRVGGESLFL